MVDVQPEPAPQPVKRTEKATKTLLMTTYYARHLQTLFLLGVPLGYLSGVVLGSSVEYLQAFIVGEWLLFLFQKVRNRKKR